MKLESWVPSGILSTCSDVSFIFIGVEWVKTIGSKQAGKQWAKKYFDMDQYSLPHEANQMGPIEMLAHY